MLIYGSVDPCMPMSLGSFVGDPAIRCCLAKKHFELKFGHSIECSSLCTDPDHGACSFFAVLQLSLMYIITAPRALVPAYILGYHRTATCGHAGSQDGYLQRGYWTVLVLIKKRKILLLFPAYHWY